MDVLVFLAVAVPTTFAAFATRADDQGSTQLVVLCALATTVPLLVRRRWPFAVLACVAIAGVLSPVGLPYVLPLLASLYTIGAHRSGRATVAAYCVVVATALVYALAGGTRFDTADVIAIALVSAIAAGAGAYIRGKRGSITTLEERTERMDREQRLLAERAVAEERVRISQELHDVVAHNVSLIVVQVQAQALGATAGDEHVREATDGIADLGRRTMAEMHRTLRLLRAHDDRPALAPQPGLADLDDLLARSRTAGLDVELAVEGAPRPLAQGVDLSAFRIVQEALTNVVKHAGRARTSVTVTYGREALELTIADDGDGRRRGGAAPGGHGLIGMRERTALLGGSLTAGPAAGQGFVVRASLPYGERTG